MTGRIWRGEHGAHYAGKNCIRCRRSEKLVWDREHKWYMCEVCLAEIGAAVRRLRSMHGVVKSEAGQ